MISRKGHRMMRHCCRLCAAGRRWFKDNFNKVLTLDTMPPKLHISRLECVYREVATKSNSLRTFDNAIPAGREGYMCNLYAADTAIITTSYNTHRCPRCRTIISPGFTASPPNFLTPRYLGLLSRPFLVLPPALDVAMRTPGSGSAAAMRGVTVGHSELGPSFRLNTCERAEDKQRPTGRASMVSIANYATLLIKK